MQLMPAIPTPFEIVLPKGLLVDLVEAYKPITIREALVAVATEQNQEY